VLGIQAWFPQAFIGMNTGSWSISCEFFFYLLFPAVLPLLREVCTSENTPRIVLYLSLFIGFLGLSDFAFGGAGTFPLVYISPFVRAPEFILGMVLGIALRQRQAGSRFNAGWLLISGVLVVLVSMNSVYMIGLGTRANFIVVPAIAWLIYAAAAFELSHPAAFKGAGWAPLRYLGGASYSIFLSHIPLVLWLTTSVNNPTIAKAFLETPIPTVGLCAAVAIMVGIILHELVEKPVRRSLVNLKLKSARF
jgi:peptidoglycan/LPS O-acetylase OafA/YrhL